MGRGQPGQHGVLILGGLQGWQMAGTEARGKPWSVLMQVVVDKGNHGESRCRLWLARGTMECSDADCHWQVKPWSCLMHEATTRADCLTVTSTTSHTMPTQGTCFGRAPPACFVLCTVPDRKSHGFTPDTSLKQVCAAPLLHHSSPIGYTSTSALLAHPGGKQSTEKQSKEKQRNDASKENTPARREAHLTSR